ncbi:MAG: ABC transporter substrate-binding protein, partial [Actinobacteria bacterium]|nr:ABC transporter substrate-binding protein [Actinomycetota bacterium]
MLLAACGGQSSTSDAAGGKTGLVIAQPGVLPNLDPVNADNVVVDSVDVAVYDPLVDYDANGNLVGHLAQKWTVGEGGKSITFTLRPNATFHDGSPVTAQDVAFTFDRIKKVGVGVAQSLSLYSSATVVDPHTVTINLTKPSSVFLGYLSQVYILNSKLVSQHLGSDEGQAWLATHDAGSGPYELSSYQPNQQVILKKYGKYSGELAAGTAQTVTVELITQAQTIVNQMLAGNIDITRGIVGPGVSQVENNAKFKLTYPTALKMLYIWFNTQRGATKNKLVREAIRDAYDYAGHIKTIGQGRGTAAAGMLPKEMNCVPTLPAATQDLTQAKQLLQQ